MRIIYTPRALRSIQRIHGYIAEDNPTAANRVVARIENTIRVPGHFPESGRRSDMPDVREMRVPSLPYVVVHRIRSQDTLLILGVYHTAQRRPSRRL